MSAFEGFSDDAFTWDNCVRATNLGTAASWFSEYPQTTGRQVFDGFAGLAEFASGFEAFLGWKVAAPFGVHCSDFESWFPHLSRDPEVSISGTRPGRALIGALERSGSAHVMSDAGDELLVLDARSNGLHYSTIRIFEAFDGPVAEVSADVLMAVSGSPDELDGVVFIISRMLAIPALLQSASYLAESPFPSVQVLMQLGERSTTYPGVELRARPRPFLDPVSDTAVIVPSIMGGELSVQTHVVPASYRFGFSVPLDQQVDALAACLAMTVGAIPKINTILDDGFRNAGPDSPAPFQEVLVSRMGVLGEGYEYVPYLSFARSLTGGGAHPGVTATPGPRFCDQCGAARNPDSRFCVTCGAPL